MRIGSENWYTAPILAERIIWRKFLSIRSLKKKMEKIGDSTNPYDLLQIWERQIEKKF